MQSGRPTPFWQVPELPTDPIVLNPRKGWLSVVKPIARDNEVTNPSFELGTTGYTAGAGSLARDTTTAYHGAYSAKYTPSAATTDGFYYGSLSTTLGQIRAVSCKFLGAAGVKYKLSVASTTPTDLVVKPFMGTGKWQWVYVFWKETSASATRRIYFAKNGSTSVAPFWVDGVQSELCNVGEVFPTTYIDGDQLSLLSRGQFPPAYGWKGARHASASYRSNLTRDGGQVLNLQEDLGLIITGFQGWGKNSPSHAVSTQAYVDGANYITSVVGPRDVVIEGQFGSESNYQLKQMRKAFGAALSLDSTTPRQPIVFLYQEFRELEALMDPMRIVASYKDGMKGVWDNLVGESVKLLLTQWQPYGKGRDAGVSMSVNTSHGTYITGGNLGYRTFDGDWSILSGGEASIITAIARHPDGSFYIGGAFTTLGGVSANRIVRYDPVANSFTALSTGCDSTVRAIMVAPDGNVYVTGGFTSAGGVANTSGIARWTGSAWQALGTGLTVGATVGGLDLAVTGTGVIVVVGEFTAAGGVANTARAAKWNGSAWSAFGSGVNGVQTAAVAVIPATELLYIGGDFTTCNGVSCAAIAYWNGTTFEALGTGLSATPSRHGITIGPDGAAYVGGAFVTAGGITVNGLARWNGFGWNGFGSGVAGAGASVSKIVFAPDGLMYITGSFTSVNGFPVADSLATWNGTSFALPDVDFPSNAVIPELAFSPRGDLIISVTTTGTGSAITAAAQDLTVEGTAKNYPTFILTGTAGTSRLHLIRSYTTNQLLSFDLTVAATEAIWITCSEFGITVTSSFRGDLTPTLLPGSSAEFPLIKGINNIAPLVTGSGATLLATWPNLYEAAEDLLY